MGKFLGALKGIITQLESSHAEPKAEEIAGASKAIICLSENKIPVGLTADFRENIQFDFIVIHRDCNAYEIFRRNVPGSRAIEDYLTPDKVRWLSSCGIEVRMSR